MSRFASDQSTVRETMQKAFMKSVEPLQSILQWYCRTVTGSAFEAEDLMQDTLMKAYGMFVRNPYKQEISKAYLFRIASNAWIDKCRKDKLPMDSNHDPLEVPMEPAIDNLEIIAAMETLVANLPSRQRVILLLIECLRFSASEAAHLLHTSEGAVKAALNRARNKLQQLRGLKLVTDQTSSCNDAALQVRNKVDEKVVYAYLAAFRSNDPQALVWLLNDGAPLDLVPAVTAQEHSSPNSKYISTSIDLAYAYPLNRWSA
jgi:RNA polymerase sigma factor (sigma-70 family)